ncbi:MAG TPA: hypothetical protein PKM21_08570 [Anaerolineales bacterium]|nr:hypothetical protein [Anaerolineales bacterium]
MKKQKQKKIRVPREKRINDILLGPLERPALQWFCKHMPAWVTPDLLTGIGVGGAALMTLGYALSNQDKNFLWLVNLGILVNWFGDSLDGSLARYRKIERPIYGFFVDHVFDAIGQVLAFIGLILSPYVRPEIAVLALTVYLLMDVLVLARMSVSGVFKISYGKIGPTEVRTIIFLINVVLYFWNPTFATPLGPISILDIVLGIVGTIFVFVFLGSALRTAHKLRDIDQQPKTQE